MTQLPLFPEKTPLDEAEVLEWYPETRWLQVWNPEKDEEWYWKLAWYVAAEATQEELRDFVLREIGIPVRRVFADDPRGGGLQPSWLYLDYGIDLVKTEPHQGKLLPGGLSRDQIREYIELWHEHYPGTSHIYYWGYAIYNGFPDYHGGGEGGLIGVAMIGRAAPHTEKLARQGKGPKVANVVKVAINRDVPSELAYEAVSAVYNAAAEEAYKRGFDFLETYTLFSETGQSLRYANWAAPGISGTQSRWRKTGIAKARKEGRRGQSRASDERKWRWWKRLTNRWPWPPKPEDPRENPSTKAVMRKLKGKVGKGDCYKASEVLYHAAGGKRAGLTPMQQRHEGVSHWWVEGPQGEVLDPTAHQFRRLPNYDRAQGKGFLTKRPSKAARELGREVGVRVNPGDERLRELERRWHESGSAEVARAYLAGLTRTDRSVARNVRRIESMWDGDWDAPPGPLLELLWKVGSGELETDPVARPDARVGALALQPPGSRLFVHYSARLGGFAAGPTWGRYQDQPIMHLSVTSGQRGTIEMPYTSEDGWPMVSFVSPGRVATSNTSLLSPGGGWSFGVPAEVAVLYAAAHS